MTYCDNCLHVVTGCVCAPNDPCKFHGKRGQSPLTDEKRKECIAWLEGHRTTFSKHYRNGVPGSFFIDAIVEALSQAPAVVSEKQEAVLDLLRQLTNVASNSAAEAYYEWIQETSETIRECILSTQPPSLIAVADKMAQTLEGLWDAGSEVKRTGNVTEYLKTQLLNASKTLAEYEQVKKGEL